MRPRVRVAAATAPLLPITAALAEAAACRPTAFPIAIAPPLPIMAAPVQAAACLAIVPARRTAALTGIAPLLPTMAAARAVACPAIAPVHRAAAGIGPRLLPPAAVFMVAAAVAVAVAHPTAVAAPTVAGAANCGGGLGPVTKQPVQPLPDARATKPRSEPRKSEGVKKCSRRGPGHARPLHFRRVL